MGGPGHARFVWFFRGYLLRRVITANVAAMIAITNATAARASYPALLLAVVEVTVVTIVVLLVAVIDAVIVVPDCVMVVGMVTTVVIVVPGWVIVVGEVTTVVIVVPGWVIVVGEVTVVVIVTTGGMNSIAMLSVLKWVAKVTQICPPLIVYDWDVGAVPFTRMFGYVPDGTPDCGMHTVSCTKLPVCPVRVKSIVNTLLGPLETDVDVTVRLEICEPVTFPVIMIGIGFPELPVTVAVVVPVDTMETV